VFETAVTSGGRQVISSGSVLSFSGEPVEIRLTQNKREFLSISFVFHSPRESASQKHPAMEGKAVGQRAIQFILTGFDNPAGCGTTKPMEIALNGSRRVYLHFRVYALPDADRLIVYNLFLE